MSFNKWYSEGLKQFQATYTFLNSTNGSKKKKEEKDNTTDAPPSLKLERMSVQGDDVSDEQNTRGIDQIKSEDTVNQMNCHATHNLLNNYNDTSAF